MSQGTNARSSMRGCHRLRSRESSFRPGALAGVSLRPSLASLASNTSLNVFKSVQKSCSAFLIYLLAHQTHYQGNQNWQSYWQSSMTPKTINVRGGEQHASCASFLNLLNIF